MRKETLAITERSLMYAVGGQLFDQAPNRQPRKVELIMDQLKTRFREVARNDNEYYTYRVEADKSYEFIENLLMSIPEFEELNLSHNEYINGVKVNDDSRPKFAFHTRYDIETSESWKNDFVDLDAFIRNVHMNLIKMEEEKDCFLCDNEESEECNTCALNPNFKVHYECSREPKGKYTFACKYDCYASCYICCEECGQAETCKHRCDSCSNECGLAINRIKEGK